MKFFEKLMVDEYLNEAPIASKGWTRKSIEKFGNTIGKAPGEKGFFEACVARMEPKMGDQAKGFCASIKDAEYNSPMWRGKGKTKEQVQKDTKKVQYPRRKSLKRV